MRKLFYLIVLFLFSLNGFSQNYQYLGAYTSNGTPLYLEDPGDNVSVETLELIDQSIPETFRVPTYNPHYITSNYDTDIFLEQETEVFVTFISEGAGFRNVLGFYTYDPNSPPSSAPADEDVTIIFPNASALGSGGGLRVGDKVSIGTFPAGTAIGWVLLSNGWNGNSVGYGYWQLYSNPNFNPEANVSNRYHNVLIKDDNAELLILGFEDINRDVSWCDHDFNDAVFYVTASAFTDLRTVNNINTATSSNVYSSNIAGFESNGDLAKQIAKRGMARLKNKNQANSKSRQQRFKKNDFKSSELGSFFPETGVNSYEVPYIATSLDLVNYANAEDVFSVDYYIGDSRVSAGLVTSTTGEIYNHAKAICDRLNGSKLIDLRNVTLNGQNMLFAIIERDNGDVEYAISFSIREGKEQNELYSLWNIADYPSGDYRNFQIWGTSMGQVAHIVNHIIDQLMEEHVLVSGGESERIPSVFISSAYYQNKELHMDVINKSRAASANINANLKRSENSEPELFNQTIQLSGDWNEHIVVETGYLFDIGLSFLGEGAAINDALYLADGPWGVDYIEGEVQFESFDVLSQEEEMNPDEYYYPLERSISTNGVTNGVFNVFRTVLPGDLALEVNNFNEIRFSIENNVPIEVALVPNNLSDWSHRLRYQVPINETEKMLSLKFDQFINHEGKYVELDNIRTVIFSVQGDNDNPLTFNLSINQLAFIGEPSVLLSVNDEDQVRLINYPNPFSQSTTLKLEERSNQVKLSVYDLSGKMVYEEKLESINDGKTVVFNRGTLQNGIYRYVLIQDNGTRFKGSFLIE